MSEVIYHKGKYYTVENGQKVEIPTKPDEFYEYNGAWELNQERKTEYLLKQSVKLLNQTDWIVTRHRDQQELTQSENSLTDIEFEQLMSYRQALRDCTDVGELPIMPTFIRDILGVE